MENLIEQKLAKSIGVKLNFNKAEIGDFYINYVTAGKGKPLLLIHGGNIGWGQWYPNIGDLSKNFTVYAIDLPGSGQSSQIDYSKLNPKTDLVETVVKFITQLNLRDLSIVGSSNGAWIAVHVALKMKERIDKLVLIDAVGFTDYAQPPEKVLSIYPIAKLISSTLLKADRNNKNLEIFLRSVFSHPDVEISKEFIEYFYDNMSRGHNLLFISRLTKLLKEMYLSEELTEVKNEVLVLWGEYDKLIPFDKVENNIKKIPHYYVSIIRKAGHIPSIEKSDEVNKLIAKFLNSG